MTTYKILKIFELCIQISNQRKYIADFNYLNDLVVVMVTDLCLTENQIVKEYTKLDPSISYTEYKRKIEGGLLNEVVSENNYTEVISRLGDYIVDNSCD